MKLLRGLLPMAVAMVLGFFAAFPAAAADVDAAKSTVSMAVRQAFDSFEGKNHPPEERARLLEALIRRYSDPVQMSASILGRFWPRYSAKEQADFAELFVRYLVANYSSQLVNIQVGNRMEVTSVEDQGERVLVHSTVFPSDSPPAAPVPVDWDVGPAGDGRPVISNISVEGVSLIFAMKEDFTSVLRTNGGKLESLSAALQKKVDDAK